MQLVQDDREAHVDPIKFAAFDFLSIVAHKKSSNTRCLFGLGPGGPMNLLDAMHQMGHIKERKVTIYLYKDYDHIIKKRDKSI